MSITVIPNGDDYDDGQGIKVRDAFGIINANFQNLLARLNSISVNPDLQDQPPGTVIGGVPVWDPFTEYSSGYVFYDGELYKFVGTTPDTGTVPGTDDSIWLGSSSGELMHAQNTDLKLGYYETVLTIDADTEIDLDDILAANNVIRLTGSTDVTAVITFSNTGEYSKFLLQVDDNSTTKYKIESAGVVRNVSGRDIVLEAGHYIGYAAMPALLIELFSSSPQYPEGAKPEFEYVADNEYTGAHIRWRIADQVPEDPWKVLFSFSDFITADIQEAIDHAKTMHKVTPEGGFQGGYGAATGPGVAIGKDAKTVNSLDEPIDAIQLGEGTNTVPRSFKVYEHTIVLPNGMINPEKLPEGSSGDGIMVTSDNEVACTVGIRTYIANTLDGHVKFVLPDALMAKGTPLTYRHNKGSYAMNVERAGSANIIWNGAEWAGVTSITIGTWLTVVSDGTDYYIVQDSGITEDNNID
jgi:hypothetical protein